jgi:hypothetical protein
MIGGIRYRACKGEIQGIKSEIQSIKVRFRASRRDSEHQGQIQSIKGGDQHHGRFRSRARSGIGRALNMESDGNS